MPDVLLPSEFVEAFAQIPNGDTPNSAFGLISLTAV
jgi:hypothetical protein